MVLVVAAVPIWMIILDALRPGGKRPGLLTILGIVIGLAGVSLLVDFSGAMGGASSGGAHIDPLALVVLLAGTFSWALGSIYSKGASQPTHALLGAAAQMLAGGALLSVLSLVTGQAGSFSFARLDARAAWSVRSRADTLAMWERLSNAPSASARASSRRPSRSTQVPARGPHRARRRHLPPRASVRRKTRRLANRWG